MDLSEVPELIDQFNSGNEKTFRFLFNRYYNLLYIYCINFVKDKEVAQEITIDSLNKLFKRHTDFKSIPSIRSFLYKSSRNQCFDHLRNKERETKKMNLFFSTYDWQQQTIQDEIDGEMLYQLMSEAMQELPEQTRSIVELFYNKGLKYREIADLLNITVRDVERQKSNALIKMQKFIATRYRMLPIFILQTYLITHSFRECFIHSVS